MEELIKHFGTQQKLARALKCNHQNIQYWRKVRIPISVCREIEKLTNGKFTRQMLRPDIFD
mgnify:FL=1